MNCTLKLIKNEFSTNFLCCENKDFVLQNMLSISIYLEKNGSAYCRDWPHLVLIGVMLLTSWEANDQMEFFALRQCTQYGAFCMRRRS